MGKVCTLQERDVVECTRRVLHGPDLGSHQSRYDLNCNENFMSPRLPFVTDLRSKYTKKLKDNEDDNNRARREVGVKYQKLRRLLEKDMEAKKLALLP